MVKRIIVDPITRIEGHLRIETEVESGKVSAGWCKGEMFRGFEALLVGRDPADAPLITQRICGVCPISHAIASVKSIESAQQLHVPQNGLLLRNLILGANFLQSHILHFYHLSALDFIKIEDILDYSGNIPTLKNLKSWVEEEITKNKILPVAPLLPKLPGDYAENKEWNLDGLLHYTMALDIRRETHQMTALFSGKMPHAATIVPGGVTCGVDAEMVENFRMRLKKIQSFINHYYIPDVVRAAELFPEYTTIGVGVKRFLSYGVFDERGSTWLPPGVVDSSGYSPLNTDLITESVARSKYVNTRDLHPSKGEIDPDPKKRDGYSWLKAPRYNGKPVEVGPLARIIVAYHQGHRDVVPAVEQLLQTTGLSIDQMASVIGRHAARGLEASLLATQMEVWLDDLKPGQTSVGNYSPKSNGHGIGLTEAPRGALGHWSTIKESKIARYQCVVPSTWNFSPRDSQDNAGPVEEALVNTPVKTEYKGLEIARVVRSFDPCIACAVH